jgi:uroporphyrinogen-III synthase
MNQTILVTRPRIQSELLAKQLQQKGFNAIIEPLFETQTQKTNIPLKPQALLITSMNAVNSLLNCNIDKQVKILAVGQKTAHILNQGGFKNVSFASGSSSSLRDLALDVLSPEEGVVVYLAGSIVTLDLSEELTKSGFNSQRITSYTISESKILSKNTISKIKNRHIDKVLIYSKNTASIFHKLLDKHNLLEYCQSMKLLCFSDRISDFCLEIGFKRIGDIGEIIDSNDK